MPNDDSARLMELLSEVKRLAKEYYRLTGRPLGVTGEIGEYEAARLLGLQLAEVRQEGYDAIGDVGMGKEFLQIKARVAHRGTKGSQRLGRIALDKPWDAVLLVVLNESFETTEIYRADRAAVEKALSAPGSRSRNERGRLSTSKLRQTGTRVWPVSPPGT